MERRLLESLLQSDAYPEPTTAVQLVQTHISYLFLTDQYVYKVKKPVDFGFLNFSTIDRRRFYCHEEVRLNRRLCPDIYLGVVEVRETSGGASLTGQGRIIDYAVKMKRLPAERMLDRLLETGQVDAADMTRIAQTVGRFHLAAETSAEIASNGSAKTIRSNWDENFQQVVSLIPVCLTERDLTLVREWVDRFLIENRDLFEQRVANGFIRDCNGDIHLENICLDEQIHIFDCIEFNHRFRYTDTTADIAFLLMDLDFHNRSDLGSTFLEEYLAITGDEAAMPILDFYKTYRAFIRGKVAGFLLRDPQIPTAARTAARERANRYFRLSRGYILRQRLPQTLFVTCGFMGSGKSALAGTLATELGLVLLNSDLTRKRLAGVAPFTRLQDLHGEGHYSAEANEATYDELLLQAETALHSGRSVIVDATFRRRADRRRAAELAARAGVRFCILHVDPPEQTIMERLARRATEPLVISDGRPELLTAQQQEFAPLHPDEGMTISLTTDQPIIDLCDQVLEALHLL